MAAGLLALALTAAACGGSSSSSGTTTTTAKPAASTTTTAPAITTPTVTVNGATYTVPTDLGGGINPIQDTGQQIVYTSGGFLPRTLYSDLQKPVTWTNFSSSPLVLSFEGQLGVGPETIAPGQSWSWTPTALQFTYTSGSGDAGIVKVGFFGH